MCQLPSQYQYWASDILRGGPDPLAEYCPTQTPVSNSRCDNDEVTATLDTVYGGESKGWNSRCVMSDATQGCVVAQRQGRDYAGISPATNLRRPLPYHRGPMAQNFGPKCMRVNCSTNTAPLVVYPKGGAATMGQDAEPVLCYFPGQVVPVSGGGFSGNVTCPTSLETLCGYDCECRLDDPPNDSVYQCGCGSNGMCHVNALGNRRCLCEPGYTGASCALEICTNSCSNAGTCNIDTGRCACTDPTDLSAACDGSKVRSRVWAFADPNLRTVDGLTFDFQGVPGYWWMLKSEGVAREFSMQVRVVRLAPR